MACWGTREGEGEGDKIRTATVLETSLLTLSSWRTSTCSASDSPPWLVISRATVVIVLWGEFGSGGNGVSWESELADLAATTTVSHGV